MKFYDIGESESHASVRQINTTTMQENVEAQEEEPGRNEEEKRVSVLDQSPKKKKTKRNDPDGSPVNEKDGEKDNDTFRPRE